MDIGELDHKNQELKKSLFMSQIELERRQNALNGRSGKKLLSSSTFLKPQTQQFISNTSGKTQAVGKDQIISADHLRRARSLKTVGDIKLSQSGQIQQKGNAADLNQHLIKLRMEQMCFKFKTRIGTLLNQINISIIQLNKFSNLSKIQEMLNFLSQKIKQKILSNEMSELNYLKMHKKEKQIYSECESEMEGTKKKLMEKQINEKNLKNKIKELGSQIKYLYDTIMVKEKQVSAQATELYQSKVMLKQNQKVIQTLRQRLSVVQKEKLSIRQSLEKEIQNNINNSNSIIEENEKFKSEIEDLKDDLQRAAEKEGRIIESNMHLNEEIVRWRERFDWLQKQKHDQTNNNSSEQAITPLAPMKKSTMSMNNYFPQAKKDFKFLSNVYEVDQEKILQQMKNLQKQNRQLKKDLLNFQSNKLRYESNLNDIIGSQQQIQDNLLINRFKQGHANIEMIQMQKEYKIKTQKIITEWKQKLFELVYKYEDEIEKMKEEISRLSGEKAKLQKKVIDLANDRERAQSKAIQLSKQVYQISKSNLKRSHSFIMMRSEQPKLQQKLVSIQKIAESNQENSLNAIRSQVVDKSILSLNQKYNSQ